MTESEIKIKANELLRAYNIKKLSLDSLMLIIKDQGFNLIEYSQNKNTDVVEEIIRVLKIENYIYSGKAFTYVDNAVKVIFLCEDLSADEKLHALAHEEGHIVLGHLQNGVHLESNIETEYEANEFAHYLLKESVINKIRELIKENSKSILIILFIILAIFGIIRVNKAISNKKGNQPYHIEYYVTDSGTKYHKKNCSYIANSKSKHRMTIAEYNSGKYSACSRCIK